MADETSAIGLNAKLTRLKAVYRERLVGMLGEIKNCWDRVRNPQSPSEPYLTALGELFVLVHRVAGSAGSFGYQNLSATALPLEALLRTLHQEGRRPTPEEREHIDSGIQALLEAWDTRTEPLETITQKPLVETGMNHPAKVWLLSRDADQVAQLSAQLTQFDYQVQAFADPEAAWERLAREQPDAVISDLSLAQTVERHLAGKAPVIYLGESETIDARLAAVRAGGGAYLVKPVEIDELMGWLDPFTQSSQQQPYFLLIVDDDRQLAERHALALEAVGMETRVLNEPLRILGVLADRKPDLILMEAYMLSCSGLDLARAVRQVRAYLSIPIVFLSVETDTNRRVDAKRLAGDDFLTKPIDPDRLVREVAGRAERGRVLRSIMQSDSLTGLLNHVSLKERLEAELARARRQQSELSFALLDLDHFKAVNDRHGHLAGDRVLKVLANLLSRRLRRSDLVGRYGGEEFAVVLTDTAPEAAAGVMNELRESFARLEHGAGEGDFHVTFSCGVVGCSGHEQVDALVQAADLALYDAKAQGRNRVVVA